MKWLKRLCVFLVLFSLPFTSNFSSANAANGDSPSEAVSGQVLKLHFEREYFADPAKADNLEKKSYVTALYEGLTRESEQGTVIPAAAESWEVSADQMTYTFHIRENAKWNNGASVTAGDFEYAWKRMLDPQDIKPEAHLLFSIENATEYVQGKSKTLGVKVLDEKTLQVKLNKRVPNFLNLVSQVAFYPVNPTGVQTNVNWSISKSMITNGPLELSKWEYGVSMTLTPNPYYDRRSEIKWDSVEITFGFDDAIDLFNKRENDILFDHHLSDEDVEYAKKTKMPGFKQKGGRETSFMLLNPSQKPLNNVNIRKALSLALDRENMLVCKCALPSYGYLPPGVTGANKSFREEYPKLYMQKNITLAKQLLAKGMKELNLKKMPVITIISSPGSLNYYSAMDLKDFWKKYLDVDVQIQVQERQTYLTNRSKVKYQITYKELTSDYNNGLYYLDYFTSTSPLNESGWRDTVYDGFVKEAHLTSDANIRAQMMQKAEQILLDKALIIPIYYASEVWVQQTSISGVYISFEKKFEFARGYKSTP